MCWYISLRKCGNQQARETRQHVPATSPDGCTIAGASSVPRCAPHISGMWVGSGVLLASLIGDGWILLTSYSVSAPGTPQSPQTPQSASSAPWSSYHWRDFEHTPHGLHPAREGARGGNPLCPAFLASPGALVLVRGACQVAPPTGGGERMTRVWGQRTISGP